MNKEVKIFLESGLLEEYIMGLCDKADQDKVEAFIEKYPEVKAVYDDLQTGIEQYAKSIAIPPPIGTKEELMDRLNDPYKEPLSPSPVSPPAKSNSMNWLTGVAAIGMALLAFWFWNNWNTSMNENQQLTNQMLELQQDCELEKQKMIALQERLNLLSNPQTEKFLLAANTNNSPFEAVAYWNKKRAASFLEIISHPKLEKGECLQLWADVDGEMVSLGVLPEKNEHFYELPFKVNAESLNVTIEPKGGSDHPNVARIVTSIPI